MSVGFVTNRSAWEILIEELGRDVAQLEVGLRRALAHDDYAAAGLYQAKLNQATSDLQRIEAAHIVGTWDDWDAAFEWAVEIGAQPNIFAARNSLTNLISTQFGGQRERSRTLEVKYAYYRKQREKAAKKQLEAA